MASVPTAEPSKPQRISQTLFPSVSFFQALRIAQAIWDELAGEGGRPIDVAAAMKIQPSGGAWPSICGAAIAFGLTEGGCNANRLNFFRSVDVASRLKRRETTRQQWLRRL